MYLTPYQAMTHLYFLSHDHGCSKNLLWKHLRLVSTIDGGDECNVEHKSIFWQMVITWLRGASQSRAHFHVTVSVAHRETTSSFLDTSVEQSHTCNHELLDTFAVIQLLAWCKSQTNILDTKTNLGKRKWRADHNQDGVQNVRLPDCSFVMHQNIHNGTSRGRNKTFDRHQSCLETQY